MTKDELIKWALEVENQTFFPTGRYLDGAVYTCHPKVWDFVRTATIFLAQGTNEEAKEWIKQKILARKETGETLADFSCGNWRLWTVLNELGVSRIRE